TDPEDGLLALFNVLEELHSRVKPLPDIGAHVPARTALLEQATILMAQPQLRYPLLIHEHLIPVIHFYNGNVRLDQAGLCVVVTLAGARIQAADHLYTALHSFQGTVKRAGNFLVLSVL